MWSRYCRGSESVIGVSMRFLNQFFVECDGVTAIEYALIAALIAVAAIAAFTLVGTDLSTTFNSIATQL